jgi:hypothetical protein
MRRIMYIAGGGGAEDLYQPVSNKTARYSSTSPSSRISILQEDYSKKFKDRSTDDNEQNETEGDFSNWTLLV